MPTSSNEYDVVNYTDFPELPRTQNNVVAWSNNMLRIEALKVAFFLTARILAVCWSTVTMDSARCYYDLTDPLCSSPGDYYQDPRMIVSIFCLNSTLLYSFPCPEVYLPKIKLKIL